VKKLEGRPFVMLGVNSDTKRRLKQALKRESLPWRSWWDGGSPQGPLATRWQIKSWPTIFLIDHAGVLRERFAEELDPKKIEAAVEKLVREAEKEKTAMIQTLEQNGRSYVSASALVRQAGIAVKTLPGRNQLAVCAHERCAVVKDFFTEGGETFLAVDSVAEALGTRPQWDSGGKKVTFALEPGAAFKADGPARVGQLAPDFRLPKLDGTPLALADLRGKRVLINSWASW
jgi:peroxiredoxin